MKQRKKIFVAMAMSLCFSICTDAVSFAQDVQREIVQGTAEGRIQVQGLQGESTQVATPAAIIKYKEKAYNCPIKKLTNVETMRLKMIPSGKVQFELSGYRSKEIWNIARVTYDSKGKKQVKKAAEANLNSASKQIALYGDRGYGIRTDKEGNDRALVVGKKIKNGKKESWKILKKVKIDVSKLKKKKSDYLFLKIEEVTGKNTVRMQYNNGTGEGDEYSGIIQVNVVTGKVKKIVTADYYMHWYDGKYVYGCTYEEASNKVILSRISLNSKKTDEFTVDAFPDDERYRWSGTLYGSSIYTFFNERIMALDPNGKVYYGTFDSKKLKQVGDISVCKNYKKYEVCGLAMKSKNEFYISYSPKIKKGMEYDHTYGRVFVAKYYKP